MVLFRISRPSFVTSTFGWNDCYRSFGGLLSPYPVFLFHCRNESLRKAHRKECCILTPMPTFLALVSLIVAEPILDPSI